MRTDPGQRPSARMMRLVMASVLVTVWVRLHLAVILAECMAAAATIAAHDQTHRDSGALMFNLCAGHRVMMPNDTT